MTAQEFHGHVSLAVDKLLCSSVSHNLPTYNVFGDGLKQGFAGPSRTAAGGAGSQLAWKVSPEKQTPSPSHPLHREWGLPPEALSGDQLLRGMAQHPHPGAGSPGRSELMVALWCWWLGGTNTTSVVVTSGGSSVEALWQLWGGPGGIMVVAH